MVGGAAYARTHCTHAHALYARARTPAHAHLHAHMHAHMHAHTNERTHKHTRTHAHTNTRTINKVWAGENGPHSGGEDGTCGNGSVCGTFASTLYVVDVVVVVVVAAAAAAAAVAAVVVFAFPSFCLSHKVRAVLLKSQHDRGAQSDD